MRKVVLLLASLGLAVLLASGVALAATVSCIIGAELCEGTEEADTLKGTGGDDRMSGLAGNDKLYGNEGVDGMTGGLGNDIMRGGPGNDDFFWRAPSDEAAFAGDDAIYGGAGNDYLVDREGRNRISGGPGNDGIHRATGTLMGGPGKDHIVSNAEENLPNTVFGGKGDDAIRLYSSGKFDGGPGNDLFLICNDFCAPDRSTGPRTFKGGPGEDEFRLYGRHNDTLYLRDGERDRIISCGSGKDTVYFDRDLDKFSPNSRCERRVPR